MKKTYRQKLIKYSLVDVSKDDATTLSISEVVGPLEDSYLFFEPANFLILVLDNILFQLIVLLGKLFDLLILGVGKPLDSLILFLCKLLVKQKCLHLHQ